MLTQSEENYLKAIYNLSGANKAIVSTNAVAEAINTKAASATDMIQKLNKKGLVEYHKYQGVTPSSTGEKEALNVIRKHRLWEVFLVQKLKFNWDEVHEVAEQLEHVDSPMLVEQLDIFLGRPKFDPHGDPIPNANGDMESSPTVTLSMLNPGDQCNVICAKDSSSEFLLYLDKIKISLGAAINVQDFFEYDGSYSVSVDDSPPITLSSKVAENIYIEKL
ncbi:MAG: metal-dependent transcriptional regulator [Bacteroidetes bacterium]|nr:MAG: metal-dependent transcriptional regulator [Bacteroidota bacterium]